MSSISYLAVLKNLVAMSALVLLTACSGLKTYHEATNKNLNITTKTDSSSVFSSVDTMLHIYSLNNNCEVSYAGTVKLTSPVMKVGIPDNKTNYLEFEFASSGMFYSHSSSISADTILKPKPGFSYDIEVSYIDDLYNVVIHEKNSNKSKPRELDLQPLASCIKR